MQQINFEIIFLYNKRPLKKKVLLKYIYKISENTSNNMSMNNLL